MSRKPGQADYRMVKISLRVLKILFGRSTLILLPILALSAWAGEPGASRAAAIENEGIICTVAMQMENPDLCAVDGPASKRVDYWEKGLLPQRPLPSLPLDPTLGELNRSYARASRETELGFYASLQDAVSGNRHHSIWKGFVYISYIAVYQENDSTYYRNSDGWYFRGDEVTPIYNLNQFSGITLLENPVHPFGWVIPFEGVNPSRSPGSPADTQAPFYPRYTQVEVFDTQQTEKGETWYMIGINQWVLQTKLGLVYPDSARPAEIPAGVKWITVNLFEQSLAAFEGDRLVFATLTASGLPGYWTRPGLFHIKKKYEYQTMSGTFEEDHSDYYYVESVPWVMYFDHDRAIHGEYWHNNLGGRHSHGCVNVPVVDGHWLFNWAPEDTWVYVFDPSGKTPTDDASYKFG